MKTLITNRILFFFLLLSLAACKKDRNNRTEAKEIINMSYGDHESQKMDVYLPANRSAQTSVIIFLHGGGFIAGDKKDFDNQCRQLSAEGFAVINANYRLVDADGVLSTPMVHKPSDVTIPDQIQDVETVLSLVISKSSEWKISNTKIGIAGHSAGATLALLTAYKNPDKVKVAANWAGVTDLSFPDESVVENYDPRLVEIFYRLINTELKNENKLAFMAISPYWVANTGKHTATLNIRPEFNIVFEMPDESKAQYEAFTNLLNNKGVPNRYIEIAGADHGFGQPGNWEQVIAETTSYMNSIMGN